MRLKTSTAAKKNVGFLTLCLVAVLMSFATAAHACQELAQIDMRNFYGIDTILVKIDTQQQSFLPARIKDAEENRQLNTQNQTSPITAGVMEAFHQLPEINIRPLSGQSMKGNNILVMSFVVSARAEEIDGKKIIAGALTLQLQNHYPDDKSPPTAIPVIASSYPFLVPNNKEAFDKELKDGAIFLTHFMPSYFKCANKGANETCGRLEPLPGFQPSDCPSQIYVMP